VEAVTGDEHCVVALVSTFIAITKSATEESPITRRVGVGTRSIDRVFCIATSRHRPSHSATLSRCDSADRRVADPLKYDERGSFRLYEFKRERF
jgi:hypothetical protein